MLSDTIRNADVTKINEFDLETWAHKAKKYEAAIEWAVARFWRIGEKADSAMMEQAFKEKRGD